MGRQLTLWLVQRQRGFDIAFDGRVVAGRDHVLRLNCHLRLDKRAANALPTGEVLQVRKLQ